MRFHVLFEISATLSELLEPKRFNVFKYSLKKGTRKVKKSSKSPESDFETNLLRISYATARTICSLHADKREYYFDIIASILNHLNFVEQPASGNAFLLRKSRIDRLRDFSQTARTGELAQGINYLFIQERVGFPFIIDYHLFCDRVGIKVSGRTADFVLLDPYNRRNGLFESKGEASIADTVTGKLNGAIKQLDITQLSLLLNGNMYARHLYPLCTKFHFVTPEISSINYCDLDSTKATDINPADIIRRHYASWFYLVSDFNRAQQLIEGNSIAPLEEAGDVHYTLDANRPIYWVTSLSLRSIIKQSSIRMIWGPFKATGFKIGIHKEFVDFLTKSSMTENPEIPSPNAIDGNNIQWFRDGTVIELQDKE